MMLRRTFLLTTAAASVAAATPEPLPVRVNGKIATRFYAGEPWDKPFLYPIQTISGKVLSRGWPLEPRDGDSQDHTWHRGFWYGHGLINNADFWREQGREKTARLVSKEPPQVSDGRASVTTALQPPTGSVLGTLREEYQLRDDNRLRLLDAKITIRADAGVSLTFGDSDDGGFAFRLAEPFREDRGARLKNANGLTGSKAMWGQPARWVHYEADLDGAPAGVALLDHPRNLRHPTRWHARGYGLCAANPFALRSFTKDPKSDGSYTLPYGETLSLRYLALIHDGALPPEQLERVYSAFAKT